MVVTSESVVTPEEVIPLSLIANVEIIRIPIWLVSIISAIWILLGVLALYVSTQAGSGELMRFFSEVLGGRAEPIVRVLGYLSLGFALFVMVFGSVVGLGFVSVTSEGREISVPNDFSPTLCLLPRLQRLADAINERRRVGPSSSETQADL